MNATPRLPYDPALAARAGRVLDLLGGPTALPTATFQDLPDAPTQAYPRPSDEAFPAAPSQKPIYMPPSGPRPPPGCRAGALNSLRSTPADRARWSSSYPPSRAPPRRHHPQGPRAVSRTAESSPGD